VLNFWIEIWIFLTLRSVPLLQALVFIIAGASNLSANTFSSLGRRIRHSFREKRRSLRLSIDSAHGCNTSATNCDGCKQVKSENQHIFRLQAGWSGVWFLVAAADLSLLQSIQAGSGTHATSCSLDAGNPVHGDKVAKIPLVLSLSCLVCNCYWLAVCIVVVILCVFAALCVYCCFYFRCRTAG